MELLTFVGLHAGFFLFIASLSMLVTLWQLYSLMSLPSDRLRGPYDKALWVLIILALPFGWLLFWIWRSHHLTKSETALTGENQRPLTQQEVSAQLMLQEQRSRKLMQNPKSDISYAD